MTSEQLMRMTIAKHRKEGVTISEILKELEEEVRIAKKIIEELEKEEYESI